MDIRIRIFLMHKGIKGESERESTEIPENTPVESYTFPLNIICLSVHTSFQVCIFFYKKLRLKIE